MKPFSQDISRSGTTTRKMENPWRLSNDIIHTVVDYLDVQAGDELLMYRSVKPSLITTSDEVLMIDNSQYKACCARFAEQRPFHHSSY